jgi:hypothetical protein
MRRLFAGILCGALLGAAHAEDTSQTITPAQAQPVLEVLPNRMGYAFERPDILIRQRLFGLAHGLSLLAAACLDLPEYSAPIQDAYAAWHEKQGKTVETLVRDLSRYYFGARAEEAEWPDLARALNLGDNIESALGQVSLADACASLPAAMSRPRYELDKLLAEGDTPAAKPAAPRVPTANLPQDAVPPAPTFGKPAE